MQHVYAQMQAKIRLARSFTAQQHINGVLHRSGLLNFTGVYKKYFVCVGNCI